VQGSSPRRPTLAFLLDHLFDGFEEALWRSVGGVRYPRWGRNAVFDLVHPRNVDVIIGLSSSVGNFIGDEAGVVLRKELGDSVPVLVTERAKLIHVLANLVKNAVEAMRKTPEGARSLTVEAGLDGAGLVRIAISDTGEGIAPQDLDRIFSFGFTTRQDGHGFGLHTCALYAGQLGGSLTVNSRGTGRGATFTPVIPLELAQA
jgi:signal transduction histidine kinase